MLRFRVSRSRADRFRVGGVGADRYRGWGLGLIDLGFGCKS